MKYLQILTFQLNEISQTDNKVKSMMELVFDITKDKEKREKGSANLVVLARERSGAELLHKAGVNNEIARLMKIEKDIPIRLNLIRCIGELCKKGIDICKDVLKSCGVPFFLDILNSKNEEVINASSYIIQVSLKKKKIVKSFHEKNV